MAEQIVSVSLVAANAGFLPKIAESTAEVGKLIASLERLAAVAKQVGASGEAAALGVGSLAKASADATRGVATLGTGAAEASAGAERLGAGSAAATAEVRALGSASAKTGEEMTLLGVGAEASGGKVASAMRLAAKSLPLLTVAVAAESAKMAGDFQQETNVLVTAAGESAGALDHVRKGILEIAQSTGTRWQDVTDGMYQLEKAGYRDADALKILKASAQGAREEGANLATVVAATTSVMASYHLNAGDAVAVTNQIKTAAGEAKTTMELFAGSLSTVLPLASANKISFADVAGSLASLTQHGTSADQASQELAFTIRGLSAPSNVAVQAMNQLGISATDVSLHLGDDGYNGRGLAGTIRYLSETVLRQMGPSGLVLLDTFKKSTTAGDDMQKMLSAMPPAVRDLSEKFSAGSLTLADYRTALKGLPADQASLAQQYVTLANKASGFNDSLRRGGPAAATYSAELKAMLGGAAGLNTALQLTGESMVGTNERIARVAAAAVGAGENVSGWEVTQRNLNTQLGRFSQTAQAVAIDLGTKLLPGLTATFGVIADHQTVIEVMVAGLVATGVVMTGLAIKTGVSSAATAVWGTTTSLAYRAANTSLGYYVFGLGVETRASLEAAAAGTGMNAVLARTAVIAGSVGAQIVGMAGRLSIVGAGLYELNKHSDDLATALGAHLSPGVEKVSRTLLDAASNGSTGQLSGDFTGLAKSLDLAQHSLNNAKFDPLSGAFWKDAGAGIDRAQHSVKDLDGALTGLVTTGHADQASKAFDLLVAAAHKQGVSLDEVKKQLPGYEAAVAAAGSAAGGAAGSTDDLAKAQDDLGKAQGALTDALKASNDAFTIMNGGALSAERIAEKLTTTTNALSGSVATNGHELDVHTAKGVANRQAITDLIGTENDKIKSDFETNQSTQGVGKAMDIAGQQIAANRTELIRIMTQAGFTQAQAKSMADQFLLTPEQVRTNFETPGLQQAQAGVDQLKAAYDALHDKSITISGQFVTLASGKHLPMADGGPVPMMPGAVAGKDSVAAMLMPHEFVVRADGSNLGAAIDHFGQRMAAGGPVTTMTTNYNGWDSRALAGGLSASVDALAKQGNDQAMQQLASMVGSGAGAAGGAARWAPLVLQVLAMLGQSPSLLAGALSLINNESGGNPNAINLTDSNARAGHPSQGLMQTIPGTFNAYAGPYRSRGITDPLANIFAGLSYALANYGAGMIANGGRHAAGKYIGYETGTPWVPETGPAILHEGEAVLTREENAQRARAGWIPAPRLGRTTSQQGGGQFTGVLRLDSGELLGVIDGRIEQSDADLATGMAHTVGR